MMELRCDLCGDVVKGKERWAIGLKYRSTWNPDGDEVHADLCPRCGNRAVRLLGFCHDTGKILSIARQEQIDHLDQYGLKWHGANPSAPLMGAMKNDVE